MTTYSWRQFDIRTYAVITSLVISAFVILFPDSPNDDSYTYIRTAEIFLDQGITAAYQHYSWATYSILIGLVGSSGIDLFTAAYLLNALFYAILTYAFISIVMEIDASIKVVAMAAVTVLVYPQLNEYRYFIIRDSGFWALSLLAFYQYLRFAKTAESKFAVGFCAALLLAATLRAEAMIYLLATPLALLFDNRFERPQRNRRFLLLAGMVATAIVAARIEP